MNARDADSMMSPVRHNRRVVAVDILRGLAVLGMLAVNMLDFSGYSRVSPQGMGTAHRLTVLFIRFFAQAKFYPLFAFLFGWGTVIQMSRAEEREEAFVPLYLRLIVLMLIGTVHAVLIWEGDILVIYALLGLSLLLFRGCSQRMILLTAIACLLIPVLLSTPGPAASIREWHARLVSPLSQRLTEGYDAGVYANGGYLVITKQRLRSLGIRYSNFIHWAPHVFGMFLLGMYAGRRRVLRNTTDHLNLFRRTVWAGLIVGVPLTLLFVGATERPDLIPAAYRELVTRGARMIGGSMLSLVYVAGVVLLTRKKTWMKKLSSFAFVGRTALSNYLLQSVMCTLVFCGYGLGLYGKVGPAVTGVLTLLLFSA